MHYDSGIGSLNSLLDFDVSRFDPDGPLPEIPETQGGQSLRMRTIEMARTQNLTIRELAQRAGSNAGLAFVGTAESIATQMEQWLYEEAADGFNITFPWCPGGLDEFISSVVPELQRRGLFRREYEGTTLREHLGLEKPKNKFFE